MENRASLALALLLAAGPALAEEAKPGSLGLMAWFQHLKDGLRESSVSGKFQAGHRSAAVAAVRGKENSDGRSNPNETSMLASNKKKRADRLVRKERLEFEAAVDLIVGGKVEEALSALDAFEKKYPASGFLADVAEAKVKAKELQAAAPPSPQQAPAVNAAVPSAPPTTPAAAVAAPANPAPAAAAEAPKTQ